MRAIRRFDESVAGVVARLPRRLNWFFKTITNFGAFTVTTGCAVVTAYIILNSSSVSDYYRHSGVLLLLLFGLGMAIKLATHRRRPDTLFVQNMRFKHFSFPSGHAFGSLLVYGFLAHLASSWTIYGVVGAIIFLIGLSRLYLGAHFPSDVVGGWAMAAVALAVVISYANHI